MAQGRSNAAGSLRPEELVFTSDPVAHGNISTCRPPLVCGVLGWIMPRPPIDAGVPVDVRRILSSALCRSGRVTFLDSGLLARPGTSWSTVHGEVACVVRPGLVDALLGKVAFPLRCTGDPSVAIQLFEDAVFQWELGGQVALLSVHGDPPPPLTYDLVTAAFSPDRVAKLFSRTVSSLFALMLPGPDGDFARFIARDADAWAPVFQGLVEASAEAAVPLRTVDGPAFNRIRWFTANHP